MTPTPTASSGEVANLLSACTRAELLEQLGEARFALEYEVGRTATGDEAIEIAFDAMA